MTAETDSIGKAGKEKSDMMAAAAVAKPKKKKSIWTTRSMLDKNESTTKDVVRSIYICS